MTKEIPVELVEQIERGNCILFLGWANVVPGSSDALPVLTESFLAQRLAERVQYPKSVYTLYEVADYFEIDRGRHALIQYVCDVIAEHDRPRSYYHQIIELPFNTIVSTSLDSSLKRLLRAKDKKSNWVVREEDLPFAEDDRLLVVKLYGDADNRNSIVITREDQIALFDRLPSMSDLLRYYFSTKTSLFVGFNLEDPNFLRLYSEVNQRTKGYQKRAYVIATNLDKYQRRIWERRNLFTLDIQPDAFFAFLADHITVKTTPPRDTITRPIEAKGQDYIHKSPYKFLNSYDEHDVDIFYGRDRDIKQTIQRLLAAKLMVFCGKSGFGKTSLICAGVIPRLAQGGYLPVYARCAGDPLHSIKVNIVDRVRQLEPDPSSEVIEKLYNLTNLSLPDFIRQYSKLEKRSLVIFIDQFEEFFISLGDVTRRKFETELAECIESPYINATFLLSLREDFLAELHEFKELKRPFENSYRLKALPLSAAREAIVQPARQFGITFEIGLVDLIVQELSGKEQIDPAQLQIVCDRLYNSMPEGNSKVSLVLYEELGGAKQILADYVDLILYNFGPRRRTVSQRLLRHMVTASYTKIPLSFSDALLITTDVPDWKKEDTCELLNDLVGVRLIRRTAEAGEEETYELAHEFLINKIREWIDLESLKVKEAQDLLRQEFNNWQRHRILMSSSALQVIDSQRSQLILNSQLLAFILSAVIKYDFEFRYWMTRNRNNQQAIEYLLWLLKDSTSSTKGLIGIAIGLLTSNSNLLQEIYQVYENSANPNTIKRIEQLEAEGFSFAKEFYASVCEVVKRRFEHRMSFVASGYFLMGTHKEEIDSIVREKKIAYLNVFDGQYPQREVFVEDFYIDRFLVTNAEFQEFKPQHMFDKEEENYPATRMTWNEAQAYAEWVGKDLPTEEEWEKAARGTDGRNFPWGNEWDPLRLNTRETGYGGNTPVDMFPTGVSPYGCYDMSGNVWEWTVSSLGNAKVLKGGSWSRHGIRPWCWHRFDYPPDTAYPNVGFRCVKRSKEK